MSEDIVGVELLPCPFCGGEAVSARVDRNGRETAYRVFCRLCVGRTEDKTREAAIAAWNIRTLTPEPSAAVDLEWHPRIGEEVEVTAETDDWRSWRQSKLFVVGVSVERNGAPGLNIAVSETWPVTSTSGGFTDEFWINRPFRPDMLRPVHAAHTNRGEVERLREAGSVIESMARAVHASTGATMSWEDDADQEACVRAVVAMFKGAVPLPEHVVDNCDGNNADVQYEWRQIVAAILDEPKARAVLSSPDTVKDVANGVR